MVSTMKMRELTHDELSVLEWELADGYRYLVLKAQDRKVMRMKYPSVAQRRKAKIDQHVFLSEISKTEGIKTRRTVERENKDDLDLIRKEMAGLEKARKVVEREFFEYQAHKFDVEEDEESEEFLVKMAATSAEMEDINQQINELVYERLEIVQYCVQELAMLHYFQRVAHVCWEYNTEEVDTEGNELWQPMWSTWEEFETANDQVIELLIGETRTWLNGGTAFFAQPPSQPDGGSDT